MGMGPSASFDLCYFFLAFILQNYSASYHNNQNTKYNFNIKVRTNKFYENTIIDMYYDETIILNPLVSYGVYKSSINNIIVNENGKIVISNMIVGIYNFSVIYENNNYVILSSNFKGKKIKYKPSFSFEGTKLKKKSKEHNKSCNI